MTHQPQADRYQAMTYARCGRSGVRLPRISLGLWHNFGGHDHYENGRAILHRAFDLGVTHFDLANNYGPPPGSAEETFGRVLRADFAGYRDEMILSTKAGYHMWAGPYGEFGSRKSMLASLEQSLRRLGLDYVDIFYSHRFDPDTPLEETLGALAQAVHQGKALYAGVSNYPPEQTRQAAAILRALGAPCLIHQPAYNLLNRTIEQGLTAVLAEEQIGCIVFSPLAQGQLTDRYLQGIPADSRAAREHFLKAAKVAETLPKIRGLHAIAQARGQSLAQMALTWTLRLPVVTSTLIGASSVRQLEDNIAALAAPELSAEELKKIEDVLSGQAER